MRHVSGAVLSAVALAASVVVAPAASATTLSAPTGQTMKASQYVEANSPAEAVKKLDALDKRASAKSGATTYAAASVRFGPCTLYPTKTYLRTSSGKSKVGAKPVTKCTTAVTSIKHASDLRYKSFIWWRKAGPTFTGGNSKVASYEQRNIEYKCVSKERTGWSGTTLGTIVWKGKTYYARVYFTENSLACGG